MALKILLIYPYFLEQRIQPEEISSPPLGIYYVGAMLRAQGFDVEILNWSQIHHSLDRARQVLRKKAPRIVGISMLHANRLGAVRIARLVKEVDPKTTVVMGGVGASSGRRMTGILLPAKTSAAATSARSERKRRS